MDRSIAAEKFGKIILWEQAVQIIARDFIKPGALVFDVGGNVGGLSVAFARMTGPEGRVVTLECNNEILPVLRRTLELNEARNVEVIERAGYSESGMELSFDVDPSFYSSSSKLASGGGGANRVVVTTISLNDVVRSEGRLPGFIKIDVEGAEFDVLKGASSFLSGDTAPPIVLEYSYQPDEARCPLALLEQHGYEFWDIYLYDRVSRAFFAEVSGMSNVLAVPQNTHPAYLKGAPKLYDGGALLPLPKGRSVARLNIEGEPRTIARVRAYNQENEVLTMCETNMLAMQHHSNSSLVFDLDRPTQVRITVESVSGEPVDWRGVEVSEITRRH